MNELQANLALAGAACLFALSACATPRIGAQIVDQNDKGVVGASVATHPPTDFKYSPPGGHIHITEMALQGGRTGPIPDGAYTLTATKAGCEQVTPVRFVVDGERVDVGKVRLDCRHRETLGEGGWYDPNKLKGDKPFLEPPLEKE